MAIESKRFGKYNNKLTWECSLVYAKGMLKFRMRCKQLDVYHQVSLFVHFKCHGVL